jgi:hypothetical protein
VYPKKRSLFPGRTLQIGIAKRAGIAVNSIA